jgi:putative ABC transport system permease protein
MFQNYLKIAFRQLARHRAFTFINLLGLVSGLTVAMFILLYVWEELHYDRFQEHADRTWRIVRQHENVPPAVTCAWPVGTYAEEKLPEVEAATHLLRCVPDPVLARGQEGFYETGGFYVDKNFFEIFSYPLQYGTEATAFSSPNSILLNREMAAKYFNQEDPTGKTLQLNGTTDYVVTGVFDKLPGNSHFNFRFLLYTDQLASLMPVPLESDWWFMVFQTYIRTTEGINSDDLGRRITATVHENSEDEADFIPQRLTDIHLHSDFGGELQANSDLRMVCLLLGIAAIILVLGCTNYINLTTSLFSKRLEEVGVRKAIGAEKGQLVTQFLTESLLMTTIAFVISISLVEMLLPLAGSFTGQVSSLGPGGHLTFLITMLGMATLTGLLSGIYPSLQASRTDSLGLLKRQSALTGGRTPVWKWLVTGQFSLAIVLIFSTLLVWQQLDFMQNKKLGFDEEHLIAVPVRDKNLMDKPDFVKNFFRGNPSVLSVSSSTNLPTIAAPATTLEPLPGSGGDKFKSHLYFVDDAYLRTLGIELLAGENFKPGAGTDTLHPVLVNEQLALSMGWEEPSQSVGKSIGFWGQQYRVGGVVKNFHLETVRRSILPLILLPEMGKCEGLVMRLQSGKLSGHLASIERAWNEIAPGQPFAYNFLDEKVALQYESERKYRGIISGATMLALLIANLGLFGLMAFAVERRRKEIGIRKVLGAKTSGIVGLLSKDFLKLVLIALVIASPLAYFFMEKWLQDFAYRIDIQWTVFALAGIVAVAVAFLTVSFQSVKAALANPVKSLRSE